MAKITPESIADLKALFQDNEKALGSNFSQLIDFFNNNKVTDNGDDTFTVGTVTVDASKLSDLIISGATQQQLATKADDSKVVHTADMRKPANDVAGIEEVNTKADESKVSTLQTQVDNSAVGTNMLRDSSDFSSNWGGYSSVSTTTEYNGYPSMVFTSSNKQLAQHVYDVGKIENSFQYTSSFWAKADNAGDKAHTELWGSIGNTDFVLTTNWVRYTAVLTSHSDANTNTSHSSCYFGVPDGNKGNVYIALPKLEKGTVATDWTPSPEDKADDSKVAHLSGANNFDTVPTVNNNPLLLASSLPSDLARTGSNQEFTGKNTFDTAPIDKATGNPYITKSDLPSGKDAVINVVPQADYDKLTDKSGVYFIEG